MDKLKFENQFESREQFESVLQKSFPFFIRTMIILCIAVALYETFFLLRLLLGMSSGGFIKHLHYGSCYAFMLLLCLWVLVRLFMFKKDTVKYARQLYRTQIILNLGVALWATAITLLDGYYHNEFNVTLFVIALMMLPIISFENPYILGTTHIVLNAVVLVAILIRGNSVTLMNFIPIATVLFLLSFFFFNNRKKLYINEYELDEIEIKQLNREIKEKDALLDEADQEQKTNVSIVASLSHAYICLYYVDLRRESFIEINPTTVKDVGKRIGEGGDAREKFIEMSRYLVAPEYEQETLEFTELTTVAQRLKDRNVIGFQFLGIPEVGWCAGEFVASRRDENGCCTHVLWAVRSVQEQKMRDEQHQAELLKQLHLVNALSRDYLNVYLIDIESNAASVIKMDGYVIEGTSKERSDYPYDVISKNYIEHRVFVEDQEMMLGVMDVQNLRERMKDHPEFAGVYRINENGSIHYYQYKFAKIEGTTSVIAGFQNVDEMIASEKEQRDRLQRALEEAKSSSEAKSTFLFNMSHDIRTPMNAILGFAKLMEKELNNPAVAKDYLSKIEYSGEYLLSLINNVLDMARIESGKVTLDEGVMHTLSAGTNAVHMSMADIKKKNLKFTHSEDFQHDYVLADEAKLNQIFVNIISNSVKYTPEGGSIHIDLKEFPSEKDGYGKFVTEISDTGIGMSEKFQREIFESFSREKNTTESKVAGTGLGMSIVKKLVDVMGGTIEVESQVGKGTTFRITNDYKLADDVAVVPHLMETEKEAINYSGKRILLAEDNDLNAEIAIAILEESGIVVQRAEDGVECLDMLKKAGRGYYDLILMDIQMPNLNGYDATKLIRQSGDDIPVIAITANAFEEDRQDALNAGMDGHIAKPIDVPKLFETLAEVLR